jgi:hypothetical protein
MPGQGHIFTVTIFVIWCQVTFVTGGPRRTFTCNLHQAECSWRLTGERWPTKTLAVEASLMSHSLMERSLEPVAT